MIRNDTTITKHSSVSIVLLCSQFHAVEPVQENSNPRMSRGSHGTYAPLTSRLRQGDDIDLESVPPIAEYSSIANTNVLRGATLSGTPNDPRFHRSSRPQISSSLLTPIPLTDNPPKNYSEDGKNSNKQKCASLTCLRFHKC
jgi:hypothetical protein